MHTGQRLDCNILPRGGNGNQVT